MERRDASVILETTLTSHIEQVRPLGVVREMIFGVVPGQPARLFYVAEEDFSKARANDPRYKELRRLGTQLEDELRDTVPIYTSSVNHSQLEGFLADCNKRGMEIKRIPIRSVTL